MKYKKFFLTLHANYEYFLADLGYFPNSLLIFVYNN